MEIRQITEDKDNYLEMLLIADPQENMIRRYLDKSDMFVLEDAGEVLTIGVVEHMKNKRCELKNLVTAQAVSYTHLYKDGEKVDELVKDDCTPETIEAMIKKYI